MNFGAGEAKISFWSGTKIVVQVLSTYLVKVESKISSTQPVWHRHDIRSVMVTVTPGRRCRLECHRVQRGFAQGRPPR